MKKIVINTALLFVISAFASQAKAQLASDAPAMKAEQVAEIQKKQAAAIKLPAPTVAEKSGKTAPVVTPAQSGNNISAVKESVPVSGQKATLAPATPATLPSQTAVQPVKVVPVKE